MALLATNAGTLLRSRYPAVFFQNVEVRTYYAYLDPVADGGSIMVNYLDHTTGALGTPVAIETGAGTDVHSSPIIHVIKSGTYQGRIVVAWADIGGGGPDYVRTFRSTDTEDISSWESVVAVADSGPYGYLFDMGNGNLGLVCNSNAGARLGVGLYVSSDGGDSWDSGTALMIIPVGGYAFYPATIENGNAIHVAATLFNTAGDGNYRDIFYMYSPDNGATWDKGDRSTAITLPGVEAAGASQLDKAVNRDNMWLCDIAVNTAGYPVFTYVLYSSEWESDAYWCEYDSGWNDHDTGVNVLNLGEALPYRQIYSTSIFIDPEDTDAVYIGAYRSSSSSDIQRHRTSDGGSSWGKTHDITTLSTIRCAEPKPIRNARPGFYLFYTILREWTDYDTWVADLAFIGFTSTLTVLDNRIAKAIPNTNNSSDTWIGALNHPATFEFRTLINVDLSSWVNLPILGVDLHLYFYAEQNGDCEGFTEAIVRQMHSDMSIAQSAWNIYKTGSNWDGAGCSTLDTDYDNDDIATLKVPATFGWMIWDITALVKDAIANRSNFLSLRIHAVDGNLAFYPQWYSNDHTTAAERPKLIATWSGIEYGSVAFTGTGALTVASVAIKDASVAFTGGGALTVAPVCEYGSSAVAFDGVGDLVITGGTTIQGAVAFTGSGGLVISSENWNQASVAFTGSGDLVVTAENWNQASVAFTGEGALAVASVAIKDASLDFSGSGGLVVAVFNEVRGAVAFTGTGALTIAAVAIKDASVAFTGSSDLVITAQNWNLASIAFTGSGALTASSIGTRTGKVVYTGEGALTVATVAQRDASVAFTGSGSLTVTVVTVGILFNGTGSLTIAGVAIRHASLTLTGHGELAVVGSIALDILGSVAFAGTGALTIAPILAIDSPAVAFTGSGSLSVNPQGFRYASAAFTGEGALAIISRAIALSSIHFLAAGLMRVSPQFIEHEIEPRYVLEVRTDAGELIEFLENAYGIAYSQLLNSAHSLNFQIPAEDTKTSAITYARELWLRDHRTGVVVRKFLLSGTREIRR